MTTTISERRPALPPLDEQLRQRIIDSGRTLASIARAADVDRSCLSRFMHGQQGLRFDAFQRVAQALDLQLLRRVGRPVLREVRRDG